MNHTATCPRLPLPARCWFIALSLWLAASTAMLPAAEPKTELLWPDGAPGAKGDRPEDKPTLTIWLPPKEKAVGTGVVICPGGGYGHLAVDHDYGHPAPMQDVQRAIRTVRARGREFGVRPDRIGVMGFSAGGHLASTAATHFDAGNPEAADPIGRESCRPDFAILCYPVIMFGEKYTHYGSQRNLLGDNPDPELLRSLSNEKQVTAQTPPTFLFHTDEDKGVPPENSVAFYLALRRHGVPAELHIYRQGRHGLGLAQCEQWLRGLGLLTP